MASEEGNDLVINDVDDEPTQSPSDQPEKPSTPPEKPSTPPEKPSTPLEKPSTPPEKPSTPPEKPSPPAVVATTKKAAWNDDGNDYDKIPPEEIRWTPEWKERWRKLLRMQLSGWTSVSTLHGVIYIGEAGRHWFERLIWFVVVCTCSGVCVFLISEIWIRWLTQPTITTVERTDYEVWNIFYPGVSFCSNNKMDTNAWEIFERKRRADWDSGKTQEVYAKRNINFTDYDAYIQALYLAMNAGIMYDTEPQRFEDEFSDDARLIVNGPEKVYFPVWFTEVLQQCNEMIFMCIWQAEILPNCSSYFHIQKTDDGYCCTFNAEKISRFFITRPKFKGKLTGGYVEGTDTDPRDPNGKIEKLKRTNSAMTKLGFTVLLNPGARNYMDAVKNDYVGWKILAHNPLNFAEVSGKGFSVNSGAETFISIRSQVTLSTDPVFSMDIRKRRCLMADEDLTIFPDVKRQMFQYYTRRTCVLECLSTAIMDRCGCLPYFYPDFGEVWGAHPELGHPDWADTTCNETGYLCVSAYAEATKSKEDREAGNSFSHSFTGQDDDVEVIDPWAPPETTEDPLLYDYDPDDRAISSTDCDCPSDCEETIYFMEMTQSRNEKKRSSFYKKMRGDNGHGPVNNWCRQPVCQINEAIKNNDSWTSESGRTYNGSDLQTFQDDLYEFGTIAHLFFKDMGVVKYRKDEMYSAIDLIAQFGGLVGLCVGFSLISILEFFYWFTMRLWIDERKRKKDKVKDIEQEKMKNKLEALATGLKED